MSVHFVYLEQSDPSGKPLLYDPILFDQIVAELGAEAHQVRHLSELPQLADKTWVFMDSRRGVELAEFDHPVDNVVYCTGADDVGFDGHLLPKGVRVRIATQERCAFPILVLVACDRWSRMRTWR